MALPDTTGAPERGSAPGLSPTDGDGLFLAGGTMEHFPGAVLLAGANGVVLGANAAAEPIASLLQGGGGEELRQAISSALAGKAAQVTPLLLPPRPGRQGGNLAYDVAVLPWGAGATALILARDITLERSLRAALIESRERYKDLVEAACDFAWETDSQGRFTFVSTRGALGRTTADLVGTPAADLLVDGALAEDSPFTTRVPVREVELWARQSDGEAACLLATAMPLFNADGEWSGARGLCRNITATRHHEASLADDRHRERLLAYILGILRDEMEPGRMLPAAVRALVLAFSAAGAAIYRHGTDGALVHAAEGGALPGKESLDTLLHRIANGEDEVEITDDHGVLFGKATHFDDSWNGALCLWRRAPDDGWGREDRTLLAEVALQIGLTNRQLARQEELESLSSTDPLTGLHNRRSFLAELERRYSRRKGWRGGAALLYIDLDNFKAVNDRHGHQRGDRTLVAVGRILREQTRSRDLVARLGGDEFAVLVEDIGPKAAQSKGRDIVAAAVDLEDLSADTDNPLGFSVGVAYCRPNDAAGVAEWMERADQAMYRVKRGGKGDVAVSTPERKGAKR
jgi:diguanylate cyclase (GGDEF)-like protein/PAS domain S-box-containing protein